MNARAILLALAGSVSLAAAGCAGEHPAAVVETVVLETVTVTPAASTDQQATATMVHDPDPLAELQDAYGAVLNNPGIVPMHHPDPNVRPAGNYSYTVADVDADGLPELLLRVGRSDERPNTWNMVAIVRGTSTPGQLQFADNILLEGKAGAGGSRMPMLLPDVGNRGVYQVSYYWPYPETTIEQFDIVDGAITLQNKYQTFLPEGLPAGTCLAQWRPVSDLTAVANLSNGECNHAY
ncbi:hypothetical protein ACFPVT_01720 [Corynebacterium choanae]|uniref:Lipoprotein n=1 Tax=Corynebacterium choanae TaxID=1862358 RepID=A0A3G6J3S5_9CORY|nr:hypothetical protein [Corynebacterium choanae]AZA12586.1 hypothetical protein CCHOA_00785 [Corynebacterium choanae]